MSRVYDARGRLFDPGDDRQMIEVPAITRAALHGASPYLLNTRGYPAFGASWQGDAPSNYMPIPTTDAEAVALGWPSIAAAVDGDIWLCDEAAGNLVGEVNGYALTPYGAPLQNREFVGCGYGGGFTTKRAVEAQATTGMGFVDAAMADLNPGTNDFSVSVLIRLNPASTFGFIIGKYDPFVSSIGWHVAYTVAGRIDMWLGDASGTTNHIGAFVALDGSVHLITISVDRNGNVSWYVDDQATVTMAALRPGTISQNNRAFSLAGRDGSGWSCYGQIAWAWHNIGVACDRTGHDNLWRHGRIYAPYAYGMANPMVAPISPSRVACWSGGNTPQVPVGYHASLVSAARGNALGTGYPCEDGASFEAIGSTDFYTNTAVAGGCARASVDGPSGMRDGVRVTMGGAWAAGVNGYLRAGGVAIVAASNVAWRQDMNYRRATVNTTARHGMYFTGDGGGPEFFTLVADAASPVDWTRAGGTCTPVGAAHNVFFTQYGAAALNDNCDFGEPAVIKNRTTPSLTWRRVGTAAAAGTSTPTYQLTNTNNRYYNPLRGQIRLIIGGFQLTDGAVFLQFGAAAAAGSLTLDYNAGQLRLRIWDATPALAATVLCGALDATEWQLVISYDSTTPVRNSGNANVVVERVNPGAPTTWLGASWGVWTAPTAAVLGLYFGSNAGANAARCYLAEA